MNNIKNNCTLVSTCLAVAAGMLATQSSFGTDYTMSTGDALNASSFNSIGSWGSGAAPAAGNTYTTGGWLLRSPSSGAAYTFGGDSLTLGNGSGSAAFSTVTANNNALIFKVASQTLTVNNLYVNGSQIRDGLGDTSWAALNGNLTVLAGGAAFIAQDTNIINSALHGTGTIYIGDNGSGTAPRVIQFTSGASDFTGNIVLNNTHGNANYDRLDLTSSSLMNFVIGANGINNGISGQGTLELGGTFAFDLTGADTILGDSWNIVNSATTTTYDGTFNVAGFTQSGTQWDDVVGSTTYQFDQGTGNLTVVPEPSSLALCGMGVAGLVGMIRRKK